MSEARHKLLARQLRRAFGASGPPPGVEPLLALVDDAYRKADEDRLLVERSLELTSQELSDRTERLRSFFESAPFAMGTARLIGDDLVLSSGNPHARALFGRTAPSSTPLRETPLPESARILWVAAARRVLAQSAAERFEYRVEAGLGTRSYAVTIAPVRAWGEADDISYVLEDVTERHHLFDQLVQRDRLASVGTLATGVAHEINNPLTYVVTNIEIASEQLEALRGEKPDVFAAARLGEILEALGDARSGSARVRVIVRELKAFGRADEERRSAVSLGPVLAFAAKMAGADVRRRAQLIVDVPAMPDVVGDETRLGQVFLNLILNAANAIPEGDAGRHRITVRAGCDETGAPYVDVSDTGRGIPSEVLPRIFEPFFTTNVRGSGTGLGLALVKAILVRFGGDVRVISTALDRGTTFRVVLASWNEEPAGGTPPSVRPDPTGRGRVLVVDDDAMVRAAVTRVLSPGHEVVVADGGRSALTLLATDRDFDLVLCDLRMDDCDGIEVFERGIARTPLAAKFRFLTADPTDAALRALCAREGIEPLEKPFDPRLLRRLAREALERR